MQINAGQLVGNAVRVSAESLESLSGSQQEDSLAAGRVQDPRIRRTDSPLAQEISDRGRREEGPAGLLLDVTRRPRRRRHGVQPTVAAGREHMFGSTKERTRAD